MTDIKPEKIDLGQYDIKFIESEKREIRIEVGTNPYKLESIDLIEIVDFIKIDDYSLSVHYKPYFKSHPLSINSLEILKVKHKPRNTNRICPICKTRFSMSTNCRNDKQFKLDLAPCTKLRRMFEMGKILGKN